MWYSAETVFLDGKLLSSHPLAGTCDRPMWEEPVNTCKFICKDRIEQQVTWFESEEIRDKFCRGEVTYVHHYECYYDTGIRSTLSKFAGREIVPVDPDAGILPWRGKYVNHTLTVKPWWVR